MKEIKKKLLEMQTTILEDIENERTKSAAGTHSDPRIDYRNMKSFNFRFQPQKNYCHNLSYSISLFLSTLGKLIIIWFELYYTLWYISSP